VIVLTVPEEVSEACTHNRTTHAVTQGTPADLEGFAVGFSLTERIMRHQEKLGEIEIVSVEEGIGLRLWLFDVSRRRRWPNASIVPYCWLAAAITNWHSSIKMRNDAAVLLSIGLSAARSRGRLRAVRRLKLSTSRRPPRPQLEYHR